MNIRDLEYLVALDEVRHFRKAAERCFVSQPTLSGQLQKLERIGCVAFERSKHHIYPTPVGQQIILQARQILQAVADLHTTAHAALDPLAGPLHMGLIPTLGPYLLAHLLPAIKTALPALELYLYEYQTAVVIERLLAGELDVGVLALPIDHPELQEMPLLAEPFYLAVPPLHPLASKTKVSLSDLQQETVLLLEEGHCLRQQALELCQRVQATEMEHFRATSLETLKYMVASGRGITLVPALACDQNQAIRYIPFAEPVPSRSIGLLYRRTTSRQAVFQIVGQQIQLHGSSL